MSQLGKVSFGFRWYEHIIGNRRYLFRISPRFLEHVQFPVDSSPLLFFVQCHFQGDACWGRQ
jgi:hypothetical protein